MEYRKRDDASKRIDVFDAENASCMIFRENLYKYLDKYGCKNANDLEDKFWYDYGICINIID